MKETITNVREVRVIEVTTVIDPEDKETPVREEIRYWDILGNYIGEKKQASYGLIGELIRKKSLAISDEDLNSM